MLLTEAEAEVLHGRPRESRRLFCGKSDIDSGLNGIKSSLSRVPDKKRDVQNSTLKPISFFLSEYYIENSTKSHFAGILGECPIYSIITACSHSMNLALTRSVS